MTGPMSSTVNPSRGSTAQLPFGLTRADIVLMVTIAMAAVVWSTAGQRRGGHGLAEKAIVEVAGRSRAYPLGDSLTLEVLGPLGTTRIAINAGSARIVSSPCLNKICIRTGVLSGNGDLAVCVPNQVLLRLHGGTSPSDFDGVTR